MELCAADVHLVYWPSDSKDEESQIAARKLQGFLCSKQVTYVADLKNLPRKIESSEEVETYAEKIPNLDLETLAFAAGTYSHFKIDPKFPTHLFYKLYKTWIANSTSGEIANAVLVVRRKEQIVGMITLGKKNGRGDIGLLAVSPDYRGQNIGTHLVQAAQVNFRRAGLQVSQVVTQTANKPACNLYENCGYQIEKIENFYHFWL
jgi:dTDP-4-amino-4,6-dideoxy-D-galactose acyltransferase